MASLNFASCNQCAHSVCVAQGVTVGTTTPSSGPNAGAIAGGVVGGVAFIAIVTFLVWWFWIRPRRELEDSEDEWEENNEHPSELKTQFREQRDARASVHTMHSVASSVVSRASNMIPIAFIPGVTNRDGTAPPVPPIPAALNSTNSTSSRGIGSAIFFSPGDLRNSAYSGTSTLDNRSTYFSRHSISPSLARESIASDVYQDNAVANPMPAQQIVMSRPNMVSVKSGSSSLASPATTSDSLRVMMPGSAPSSGKFSKPTAVTITKKSGRFPVRQTSNASSNKPSIRSPLSMATDESDDDEEPHARARQSLLRDTDSTSNSPFADDASRSDFSRPTTQYTATTTLSAVIEEATWRASQVPTHRGLGGAEKRTTSPFGDEHELD
ncbi:hypothetical protein ANO11243_036490 [Dothideomycetidae sp. 11243]|nr:hypothetical protein ANO11243_036490 [fungal sp. No.11243]